MSLAATEGPDAITTTRVASETGVSIGTLYRYFEDRNALMLAAYDATLEIVVDRCAGTIAEISDASPAEEAVKIAVAAYLDAAGSVPGHIALLREARRVRPITADGHALGDRIAQSILLPMVQRFGPANATHPGRVHALVAVMSALVDLFQANSDSASTQFLRDELDAHAVFALQRAHTR
jgi:AcrR family transcriptional regulator